MKHIELWGRCIELDVQYETRHSKMKKIVSLNSVSLHLPSQI